MSNKNTEFLRAITGPKIEYNGSPTTRYSTWEIGGGIKVDENPFFGKLNLSIDDQHIIDLIDTHGGGGGGGGAAEWVSMPFVVVDSQNLTPVGTPPTIVDGPVLRKVITGGAVRELIVDIALMLEFSASEAGLSYATFERTNPTALPYELDLTSFIATSSVEVVTPGSNPGLPTTSYVRPPQGGLSSFTVVFDAFGNGLHKVNLTGRARLSKLPA